MQDYEEELHADNKIQLEKQVWDSTSATNVIWKYNAYEEENSISEDFSNTIVEFQEFGNLRTINLLISI